MRIERDVLSAAGSGIDNATNAILCHGNLCKPTAQIGTSWITPQTPGVAIIFWVSIIHLILALLPTVVSCCKSCFCGASEEEAQASAAKFDTSNKITGGCNSFTTIVLAILGIVCVKVDCKEMLMACVIMAFIALIIAAIQVAIAIWGVFVAGICCCGGEDTTCGEKVAGFGALLCAVATILIWALIASILNILLVSYGWGPAFQ